MNVDLSKATLTGKGSCDGGAKPRHDGFHPGLSLDNYPLLAWCHTGHPLHGDSVFTADQKASVDAIAKEVGVAPNLEAIAAKFGTTVDFVTEALDYAVKAGVIA